MSTGLVHRIFNTLFSKGILHTSGHQTAKTFSLKKPQLLLQEWATHYNILKKCKMWTYRSPFQKRSECLHALEQAHLDSAIAQALHTAAEAHGVSNTNLNSFECYLLDPTRRPQIEEALHLEPKENGYEVLLIAPYYKSLLPHTSPLVTPPLLTYLDLYHFPLRGREQADFLATRSNFLEDGD